MKMNNMVFKKNEEIKQWSPYYLGHGVHYRQHHGGGGGVGDPHGEEHRREHEAQHQARLETRKAIMLRPG